MAKTMAGRFWSKVSKTPDCWEWTGSRRPTGYGRFRVGRLPVQAHRLAWEQAYGPVPADLHVLHRCDNRACVRPSHLFLGTNADNVADKVTKDRQLKGSCNPTAKLDEQQVADLRKTYAQGHLSQRDLAQLFGVSPTLVNLIVTGRNWKHVPL